MEQKVAFSCQTIQFSDRQTDSCKFLTEWIMGAQNFPEVGLTGPNLPFLAENFLARRIFSDIFLPAKNLGGFPALSPPSRPHPRCHCGLMRQMSMTDVQS